MATPEQAAVQRVVNKLTNWQRNQWAKAGYPGLGSRKKGYDPDPSKVEPFTLLHKCSYEMKGLLPL